MTGNNVGALKRRARMAGVSVELLNEHERRGEYWCTGCKAFHPRAAFGADRARPDGRARTCRAARARAFLASYTPSVAERLGPLPAPARDGDRAQARKRVGRLVATGRLPHPNALPCSDCPHVWSEGERRHEYDHHLGYAAEHHLHVEAVCTTCHRGRAEARGEIVQTRDRRGRYARAAC